VSTATETLTAAMTIATEARDRLAAMPKGQTATDPELRALRSAIHAETKALALRIRTEIGPLLRALPEAVLAGLDYDAIEAEWATAAGPCKGKGLCEILA